MFTDKIYYKSENVLLVIVWTWISVDNSIYDAWRMVKLFDPLGFVSSMAVFSVLWPSLLLSSKSCWPFFIVHFLCTGAFLMSVFGPNAFPTYVKTFCFRLKKSGSELYPWFATTWIRFRILDTDAHNWKRQNYSTDGPNSPSYFRTFLFRIFC